MSSGCAAWPEADWMYGVFWASWEGGMGVPVGFEEDWFMAALAGSVIEGGSVDGSVL